MKKIALLFATGFGQVFLVSANIYFISRTNWIGIAFCGFGVSFLWTFNVRKVTIGTRVDQLVYSFGAMAGGLTGVVMAKTIKK
jgi:hypothetical protein